VPAEKFEPSTKTRKKGKPTQGKEERRGDIGKGEAKLMRRQGTGCQGHNERRRKKVITEGGPRQFKKVKRGKKRKEAILPKPSGVMRRVQVNSEEKKESLTVTKDRQKNWDE